MNRFDLSIKDVKDGMLSATEYNVYWWAWIYWMRSLNGYTESLMNVDAADVDGIGFYRYCVIEAKKVLSEMYEKMVQMPQFQGGWLDKPEWMDEFLDKEA